MNKPEGLNVGSSSWHYFMLINLKISLKKIEIKSQETGKEWLAIETEIFIAVRVLH